MWCIINQHYKQGNICNHKQTDYAVYADSIIEWRMENLHNCYTQQSIKKTAIEINS